MRDESLLQPPSLPSSSSVSTPTKPMGNELASFSGAGNKRRTYMKGISVRRLKEKLQSLETTGSGLFWHIFHWITSSLDNQPASSGFPPVRYARQIPIKGSGTVSIFFIAFDIFSYGMNRRTRSIHRRQHSRRRCSLFTTHSCFSCGRREELASEAGNRDLDGNLRHRRRGDHSGMGCKFVEKGSGYERTADIESLDRGRFDGQFPDLEMSDFCDLGLVRLVSSSRSI
ncbi:hypothetical protein M5K25_009638 [Dendrobium thyrsiflorum]|uniref:Uncharacterized protein n=1 Tax=Dendrobium thyrsiflorum TaxID=117978 RepID=A0ABD0V7D0_DENTH